MSLQTGDRVKLGEKALYTAQTNFNIPEGTERKDVRGTVQATYKQGYADVIWDNSSPDAPPAYISKLMLERIDKEEASRPVSGAKEKFSRLKSLATSRS